jgi:hypothetical protein
MNGYVTKPFEELTLLNEISSLLGKSIRTSTVNIGKPVHKEEILFDLEGLRKLSRGNDKFIQKMIGIFKKSAPDSIHEMRSALGKGDLETIRAIAHKLKPSIDNLSINPMKTKIREIEAYPDTKDVALLEQMINESEEIFGRVVAEFNILFAD